MLNASGIPVVDAAANAQMTNQNLKQIAEWAKEAKRCVAIDWKTNLIVTTNKRIYVFDLEIIEDKDINYKVEFSYPDEIKQKQKDKLAEEKRIQEVEKNKENIENELNKVTIPKNWDFLMHINKGSDTISPDFAYDDGVFTYLGFSIIKISFGFKHKAIISIFVI